MGSTMSETAAREPDACAFTGWSRGCATAGVRSIGSCRRGFLLKVKCEAKEGDIDHIPDGAL